MVSYNIKDMQTYTARDVQRNLKQILEETPAIISQNGVATAVLISIDDYQKIVAVYDTPTSSTKAKKVAAATGVIKYCRHFINEDFCSQCNN